MTEIDNALLELGFNGKLNEIQFSELSNLIKENNLKVEKENGINFSSWFIESENGCNKVVALSEKKYESNFIIIENTSKNKYHFESRIPKNSKFEVIVPASGTIKKGENKIEIKSRVFCTTKLNALISFQISQKGTLKHSLTSQNIYVLKKINGELSIFIDYDEIEFKESLNNSVTKAFWRNSVVVAKTILTEIESEREKIRKETLILKSFNHQNIVTYMGSTILPDQPLVILMEFVRRGSLDKHDMNRLPLKLKYKFCLDLAHGIDFLHQNGMIHGNLIPSSVLVTSLDLHSSFNLKLTDFGIPTSSLNKLKSNNSLSDYELKSFLCYHAPEVLKGEYSMKESDCYSFAILLWFILVGIDPCLVSPFLNFSFSEVCDFILSGGRLTCPSTLHPHVSSLIESYWIDNVDSRPPCSNAVPILNKLYNDEPELLSGPLSPRIDRTDHCPPEILGSQANQYLIGWVGVAEREEAEAKLKGKAEGTFLTRYSPKRKCFVVSFIKKSSDLNDFGHISGPQWHPQRGMLIILSKDGEISEEFKDLKDYVNKQKEKGRIEKSVLHSILETYNLSE